MFSVAYDTGLTGRLQLPWQRLLATELLAAGLAPNVAADALRGMLYTVGGFIVIALRRAEEGIGSEQAWADVDDADIDPALRDRMAQPPDFDAVFTRTITALVEGLVPEE